MFDITRAGTDEMRWAVQETLDWTCKPLMLQYQIIGAC